MDRSSLTTEPGGTSLRRMLSPRLLPTKWVGVTCVIFTALGWGLNWPATKRLVVECPPLSARGICGLLACLMLFIIALTRRESLQVHRAFWWRLSLAALLNVSVWMGFTTASMLWLKAGQAATLAYTMPIWVCLLAWPLLKQRPTLLQVGSVVMGLAGVLVLLGAGNLDFTSSDGPGIAMALSAAVLFAFSTVYGKRAPFPIAPIALTAWQVGLGSIPLLVAGCIFEHPNFGLLSSFAWSVLAYTALISMGLCYLTWFMAVTRLSASTAAIGTLLTPVIGVTASAFMLGDPLTAKEVASLALVAGGIILAVRDLGKPAAVLDYQPVMSSRARR